MRYWAIIAILAGGCVSPVELDFSDAYQPKVVVYSEFAPDSVWTLRLHRSASIEASVDWTRQVIGNAVVSVTDNRGFGEQFAHIGDGFYQSALGSRPRPGHEYVLNVTAPTLQPVSAVSGVPPLSVTWTGFEEIRPPEPEKNGLYEVQFMLADEAGRNIYRIAVHRLGLDCWTGNGFVSFAEGGGTDYRGVEFTSSFSDLHSAPSQLADPSEVVFAEEELFGWAWFSDELFEGKSLQITLRLAVAQLADLAPYFTISVASLSSEFREYEVSVSRADHFEQNFFRDRPVPLYSNVTGGLGIFGGVNRSTWRVDAEGNPWAESDLRVGVPCIFDDGG